MSSWTDREILAWLDEQLSVERMAAFEAELRQNDSLRTKVSNVIRYRDQGGNSVGEIWQRGKLSCPTRTELGAWVLGALTDEVAEYIQFHLHTIGCRMCQANLSDLEEQSIQAADAPIRRRRFFESSAGLLREHADSGEFLSEGP